MIYFRVNVISVVILMSQKNIASVTSDVKKVVFMNRNLLHRKNNIILKHLRKAVLDRYYFTIYSFNYGLQLHG